MDREAITLLREALEACLEVLPELDSTQSQTARKQAHIALHVTSGQLPKGYEVIQWPMSFRITLWKKYVIVDRTHASFDTEFAARRFCWQHAQEQGGMA